VYYNWQWANTFLAGGRKKHTRPLYDRGLRIWKLNKWDADSDIAIGWASWATPLVTYHKDGTTTIQSGVQSSHAWNPLNNYSTRFTIMRYAGIQNLYRRNFKFYIIESEAGLTPPKIQGCRQCKQTGLQDVYCYPQHCWQTITNSDGVTTCTAHPEIDPAIFTGYTRWHMLPCSHGNLDSHTVKNGATCYYCQGTKKRDYGSKLERTQWDGTPLRLRDGKLIKSAATLLERMVADYVQPIN